MSRQWTSRPRRLHALALVALLAGSGCAGTARDASREPGAAVTVRFTTPGALRLTRDLRFVPAEPVELTGDLRLPPGPGPFPVVLLMHGCSGQGRVDHGWVEPLIAAGHATLRVDSFGGRGLRSVCADAFKLTPIERVPDAYGALASLTSDSRLDTRRVALMGFSHGGMLTLGASTAWARQRYAPAAGPTFRAFVAFYPTCGFVYPERTTLAGPLRIHVGELDDWTPAAPCAELVRELKAAGQDAEIVLYPGAKHGFDRGGGLPVFLADADNPAACVLRAPSILGPLENPGDLATCLRKGATIGGNPAATERARRIVLEQLAELLR